MSSNSWLPVDLPPGWAAPKIDELCTVVRGGSPRPMGDPRYFGGSIPFVKIADVTRSDGQTIYDAETKVTIEGSLRSRLISAGRLILTNSATVCVPVFLGVEACIHDGFVAFEGLPVSVSEKYLFHFFKYIRPFVLSEHKQGVTQVNLNTGIVGEMRLLLPPVNEQRRIIAKIEELFSELDKGVESLTTAREQLKVYRQAVLKHAFEGNLTANWRTENKTKLSSTVSQQGELEIARKKYYAKAVADWEQTLTEWQDGGSRGKRPPKPSSEEEVPPVNSAEVARLPVLPSQWTYTRLV